jgi:hypothetical protein
LLCEVAYLPVRNRVDNHQTVPVCCLRLVSCDGKQPIVFHMIFSSITFSSLGCFICNCNMNAIFLQSWVRTATDCRTGAASVCCAVTCVSGNSGVWNSWLETQGKAFNPLKPKLVHIVLNTSVRTSKRTLHHHKDQFVNIV